MRAISVRRAAEKARDRAKEAVGAALQATQGDKSGAALMRDLLELQEHVRDLREGALERH